MLVAVVVQAAMACKGGGERGPNGPGAPGGNGGTGGGERAERASYFLTSSSLAATSPRLLTLAQTTDRARPCTVAGTAGTCVTPTRARGKVVNLSLSRSGIRSPGDPTPPAQGPDDLRPARLFGGGEGFDRNGNVSLAAFDLGAPRAIPGDGALQDHAAGTTFDGLDTLFGYLDVQVPLGGRFFTLRFAFYPQPLADDPLVKMCVSETQRQNIARNGTLVDGAPAFERGDVLFCEKTTADEECAAGDFKWLDTGSGTLAPTRPGSPRRIDFVVREGIECRLHPEGPTAGNHYQPGELRLNGFRMGARLGTPVAVWARHEMCNKVFAMKDPSGKVLEGTSLSATINYDLSGFVFLPGVANLAAASLPELLAAVTLAPVYARDKLGPGPASSMFGEASVTLALGNEPHAPCGGGGDDRWDGGSAPPPGVLPGRDAGPSGMMMGPGPSDAADGVHPATTMPPGCVPDAPVRLTAEGGHPCAHTSCPAPEWTAIPYTPWSRKTVSKPQGQGEGVCQAYCLRQTCPAEGGTPQTITCMPSCP